MPPGIPQVGDLRVVGLPDLMTVTCQPSSSSLGNSVAQTRLPELVIITTITGSVSTPGICERDSRERL